MFNKLPFPSSLLDWSDPENVEFEAWDIADGLVSLCEESELAEDIRVFFALGLYQGEVENGGHSQLLHNLDVKGMHWLMPLAASRGGKVISDEFRDVIADCVQWTAANPVDARAQTGFEGGRAAFLDALDERYDDLNSASMGELERQLGKNPDRQERAYLDALASGEVDNPSHFLAMRIIWLKRSGLLEPTLDAEVDALFEKLRERQP